MPLLISVTYGVSSKISHIMVCRYYLYKYITENDWLVYPESSFEYVFL